MTTNVTILNNGPDNVTVDVVGADGKPRSGQSRTLVPGQFVSQLYVYVGQTLAIAEVTKGAAPAGNFANGPSDGPAPMEPLSSPMAVLKRHWFPLTEQQIDAKVQAMSKADYEMLPGPVREKMHERTAYFQANDTNFKRPPWYEGNATHPFYPPK